MGNLILHLPALPQEQGNPPKKPDGNCYSYRKFADEIVPYFGLCNLYENIAYECMELGRHDEALDWLEILYKVMKEHNDRCGIVTHPKTMILSGETVEWGGGGRGAARVCMQYTLEFQWFDPIRDTDRFRELVRPAGELDE